MCEIFLKGLLLVRLVVNTHPAPAGPDMRTMNVRAVLNHLLVNRPTQERILAQLVADTEADAPSEELGAGSAVLELLVLTLTVVVVDLAYALGEHGAEQHHGFFRGFEAVLLHHFADEAGEQEVEPFECRVVLLYPSFFVPGDEGVDRDGDLGLKERGGEGYDGASGCDIVVRGKLGDFVSYRSVDERDGIGVGEQAEEILGIKFLAVEDPRNVYPSLDLAGLSEALGRRGKETPTSFANNVELIDWASSTFAGYWNLSQKWFWNSQSSSYE